jgi:hypothetical protein
MCFVLCVLRRGPLSLVKEPPVGNTLARVTFLVLFSYIYFVRRVTFVDDGAALGIIIIITHLIFFPIHRLRARGARCNSIKNIKVKKEKTKSFALSAGVQSTARRWLSD